MSAPTDVYLQVISRVANSRVGIMGTLQVKQVGNPNIRELFRVSLNV